MSETRRQLQVALYRYTTDTLIYIKTVREFCEKFSKWKITREKEITSMIHIEDRADKINLNFSHVTESEEKGKAFKQYTESKLTQITADSRRAKLEKELSKVLNDTLEGLKKLNAFLDAVAKLAVTSLHVFRENQVLHLPTGISFEHVQAVITAARLICPLLLECKRDTETFFLPKLQNVEVLKYKLNRYMQVAEEICETMKKSSLSYVWLKIMDTEVDLNVDLSEDNIRRMLHQIELLDEIRKDPNFQMVFLFQDVPCSHFIKEFNDRHPGMLQFLTELEECAVQLDRMNKGAKISSVAGCSVGAVGGVLSFVGLALAPVTVGVSLILTMTGLGLGITSGVNSVLTTAAEVVINFRQQKKADIIFQKFMEDVQSLQNCLEKAANQTVFGIEVDYIELAVKVGKIATTVYTIGKSIDSLVDAASAFKVLRSEKQTGRHLAQEGKALHNPGPLFIAGNALFIGMDIFSICKDSVSLAKGSETEVSQFIRARAALWRSEIDSWQKIRDTLIEGMLTSARKRGILDTQFYSGRESSMTRNENSI